MQRFWSFLPLGLDDDASVSSFSNKLNELTLQADQFIANEQCSLEEKIQAFESLDLAFENLEKAIMLKAFQSLDDQDLKALQQEIERLGEHLYDQSSAFIEALLNTPPVSRPMWLDALLTEGDSLVVKGENLALNSSLKASDISTLINGATRLSDGSPADLNIRLSGLTAELKGDQLVSADQLFAESFSNDVHEYFCNLLSQAGENSSVSLECLRQIEREPWHDVVIMPNEAVSIIYQAFSELDEAYGERVIQAYREGRIRFVDSENAAMCIDTPAGSYIQLSYSNDLESLTLLAHECGHLVHQESVREVYTLSQEISAYLSEAIAIGFECHALNYWFKINQRLDLQQTWQKSQQVEWYHRHLLLSLFERKLYDLERVTEDEIDALWLSLNRRFYPNQVIFSSDFSKAWRELKHIVHSPFYLVIYPFSYMKSQDVDFNREIFIPRF